VSSILQLPAKLLRHLILPPNVLDMVWEAKQQRRGGDGGKVTGCTKPNNLVPGPSPCSKWRSEKSLAKAAKMAPKIHQNFVR